MVRRLHDWLRIALVVVAAVLVSPPAARGEDSRGSRVDALFAPWDKPDSPGCAVGVIRDGRFIHRGGYGMADLDDGIPITSQSVFRIGSVSKQFTVMAVLLAAEQGKLRLDDEVQKYLPELPRYERRITLRQLIHHTSGIRDYLTVMTLAGKRDEDYFTNEEVIAALARLRTLNFAPGDRYLYSNSGYFLLSQILERATGQSLRELAAEGIFQPLGMTHTHFHDDFRGVVEHRAVGYRPREGGGFEIDTTRLEMVGDGGVFTTIEDLLLWDQNFYEPRVGGEAAKKAMLEVGVLDGGLRQVYAGGLRIGIYRGLRTVGHGGAFVGYRANLLRFPDDRFTALTLCNLSSIDPGALNRKIAEIYLEDRMEPATASTISLSADGLRDKAGVYWSSTVSGFADVTVDSDRLVLQEGGEVYPLLAMSGDRFRSASGTDAVEVRFEKASPRLWRMNVRYSGQRPFVFEQLERSLPRASGLESYQGSYVCEELGASYRIDRGEDGSLMLRIPNQSAEALEPVFPDGFRWRGGSVLFVRDENGPISGFRLQAEGDRNFEFTKLPDR